MDNHRVSASTVSLDDFDMQQGVPSVVKVELQVADDRRRLMDDKRTNFRSKEAFEGLLLQLLQSSVKGTSAVKGTTDSKRKKRCIVPSEMATSGRRSKAGGLGEPQTKIVNTVELEALKDQATAMGQVHKLLEKLEGEITSIKRDLRNKKGEAELNDVKGVLHKLQATLEKISQQQQDQQQFFEMKLDQQIGRLKSELINELNNMVRTKLH